MPSRCLGGSRDLGPTRVEAETLARVPCRHLRVVDVLDARVEAETLARVSQLLHTIIEVLCVELVLRVLVTGMQCSAVHPAWGKCAAQPYD